MENAQKVYQRLAELAIGYELIHHPAVFTIDDMEHLTLPNMEFVVKNLFLRDEKGKTHFLVVLDKDKKADLKHIRSQIGSSALSFASEERLMQHLQLSKGEVTPLGVLNDAAGEVKVVFDTDLVGREKIGVHPNDNTATVFLSFADLKKVIESNRNPIYYAKI